MPTRRVSSYLWVEFLERKLHLRSYAVYFELHKKLDLYRALCFLLLLGALYFIKLPFIIRCVPSMILLKGNDHTNKPEFLGNFMFTNFVSKEV